jgi:hypothetical protein
MNLKMCEQMCYNCFIKKDIAQMRTNFEWK